MKYVMMLALWMLAMVGIQAQPEPEDRQLTIRGQLLDADLKEPMVQVTIQLFQASDSTFAGGTVSNERGNFYLEAPSPGTYKLRISSVGYQTIERELTLRRNENQDLGNLLMESETVMLQEAVVTGRAAQVIVRKDTIVYNPEAFRTPEGSPIEELIKRIPGAGSRRGRKHHRQRQGGEEDSARRQGVHARRRGDGIEEHPREHHTEPEVLRPAERPGSYHGHR